jgi:type II secretion system protein G
MLITHAHSDSESGDGERGFTLIELMVVVAIIAILAGILIPNFVNARAQAQTSACESNLRSIATALELVYTDVQSYEPNGQATFVADPADFTNATSGVQYLNNTPKDPAALDQTKDYSITATAPANGAPPSYVITCPGTHVGSTLQKIQSASTGQVCGGGCTATTLTYTSGTGLQVP